MSSIKRSGTFLLNVIFIAVVLNLFGGLNAKAAPIPRQYIVSQTGGGDFLTIQEAVNAAEDGDTLIIYPGIYCENVAVMGKALNIIGIDKNYCILQCDTSSYRSAPLTIASGKVANMTIYGMNSGIVQTELTQEEIDAINNSIEGDSWERQKNYSGYSVHVDQNILYGREMIFENCKIISENNHCVGMGSRGKSRIVFDNCEFISMGLGSCLYMHDTDSSKLSGVVNLIVRNSNMTSYLCPFVMSLQTLSNQNTTYLTFQNVHVSTVAFTDKKCYLSQGMSNMASQPSIADTQNFIMYNSTMTTNVNTYFDIDTMELLEQAGMMPLTGFTSCLNNVYGIPFSNNSKSFVVNRMSREDTNEHMLRIEKAQSTHNYSELISHPLKEGINYLGEEEDSSDISAYNTDNVKRQTIAIYNYTNAPGNGWCGLINTYLTSDSFGNTLYEMNAVN